MVLDTAGDSPLFLLQAYSMYTGSALADNLSLSNKISMAFYALAESAARAAVQIRHLEDDDSWPDAVSYLVDSVASSLQNVCNVEAFVTG